MNELSALVQFFFSGLTSGSVYALIAVSLVIVYKVSLLICFAQGEFFVIGALTMVTLTSKGCPCPLHLRFPSSSPQCWRACGAVPHQAHPGRIGGESDCHDHSHIAGPEGAGAPHLGKGVPHPAAFLGR